MNNPQSAITLFNGSYNDSDRDKVEYFIDIHFIF